MADLLVNSVMILRRNFNLDNSVLPEILSSKNQ